LHRAAISNHYEVCAILVQNGADHTQLDWKGRPAAILASKKGKETCARTIAKEVQRKAAR